MGKKEGTSTSIKAPRGDVSSIGEGDTLTCGVTGIDTNLLGFLASFREDSGIYRDCLSIDLRRAGAKRDCY